MINWNISKEDMEIIVKIVMRAENLFAELGKYIDHLSLEMDIVAIHLNDYVLDLDSLLNANDFNFIHDIGGIIKHINRENGTLMNCFVPRFAKKEVTKK